MSSSNASLRLADLFEAGRPALMARYGSRLQPHQWQAMTAIEQCRTEQLGQIHRQCPDCGTTGELPRSCGHRSCPACQNHTTTQWLERQQAKRLPSWSPSRCRPVYDRWRLPSPRRCIRRCLRPPPRP
jgi:ribosomal protein L32